MASLDSLLSVYCELLPGQEMTPGHIILVLTLAGTEDTGVRYWRRRVRLVRLVRSVSLGVEEWSSLN